jgi:hypothetical protein
VSTAAQRQFSDGGEIYILRTVQNQNMTGGGVGGGGKAILRNRWLPGFTVHCNLFRLNSAKFGRRGSIWEPKYALECEYFCFSKCPI